MPDTASPSNNPNARAGTQDAAVLEVLASRICHDLISPVGAINNGMEFIQEMGADNAGEALDLITYSAGQAAAKLQAFRLAYGAGGRDPNIKPEDVQRTFSGLIAAEGKITQSWDPYGPLGPVAPLPPAYCKMLMCALMMAAECLPRGGTVSVKAGEGPQTIVTAEGEGAAPRANTDNALDGTLSADDLDPRLVHPYAIGLMAKHYGYGLKLADKTPGTVTLILDCPAN